MRGVKSETSIENMSPHFAMIRAVSMVQMDRLRCEIDQFFDKFSRSFRVKTGHILVRHGGGGGGSTKTKMKSVQVAGGARPKPNRGRFGFLGASDCQLHLKIGRPTWVPVLESWGDSFYPTDG